MGVLNAKTLTEADVALIRAQAAAMVDRCCCPDDANQCGRCLVTRGAYRLAAERDGAYQPSELARPVQLQEALVDTGSPAGKRFNPRETVRLRAFDEDDATGQTKR